MGNLTVEKMVTENILDLIMTTKEASERYNVADCTFRTWIKDGLFKSEDIKKSGNTWLIKREAIEFVLREKNMYGKTFLLDGENIRVEHLGYKGKKIKVWFENQNVKEIVENMPQNELILQMFEVFREDTGMNFKDVIIEDNSLENDNWFFRKEKVWTLTLKSVFETVRKSMEFKDFDTSNLDEYMNRVSI